MDKKSWLEKMIDERKDTPEWKDATIEILEGEITALKSLLTEKEKEIVELKELKDAISEAQKDNDDEVHCTCVPLLKVKIKDLQAQLTEKEAERERLSKLLIEARMRIMELEAENKKLWEGIEKHQATPNATICDLPPNVRILAKLDADEELYNLIKGR